MATAVFLLQMLYYYYYCCCCYYYYYISLLHQLRDLVLLIRFRPEHSINIIQYVIICIFSLTSPENCMYACKYEYVLCVYLLM